MSLSGASIGDDWGGMLGDLLQSAMGNLELKRFYWNIVKEAAMSTPVPLPAPRLSLRDAVGFLAKQGLLRETIHGDDWSLDLAALPDMDFDAISYDTRTVTASTLLFCKGAFKGEYLRAASACGLSCYVAETPYDEAASAWGVIVTDVRKAMALLSARFYGNPERKMFVVGITGTKGKTTTAYYTHSILNRWTKGHAAILSSEADCLDGEHWIPSDLTTPESLDLFRLMREALDNGMTHLVMEISSQAYKVNRVYGVTYDIGAFLNISPDHISPIEHPTFEDYFYCKRRLVANSKQAVINAALGWKTALVEQAAQLAGTPYTTFSMDSSVAADVIGSLGISGSAHFRSSSQDADLGGYSLAMDGDFNYDNALAAVAIALAAGVTPDDQDALHAFESVAIPGRMQRFDMPDGVIAYVDYAHNYISLKSLLEYVRGQEPNSRITVVTGTAGGKAIDRRAGLAKAASENADCFILTQEDSDFEDVRAINDEMQSHVTNPALDVRQIYGHGREDAIREAFRLASKDQRDNGRVNVVLVIGKGDEAWVKIKGKHVPVRSDIDIVSGLAAHE